MPAYPAGVQVELAIDNNLDLYARVLGAHGIRGRLDRDCWWTDAPVIPYYSNLVTRRDVPARSAGLGPLASLAARPPSRSWGLKDSFARLDPDWLGGLGLAPLFEAVWYGLGAGTPGSTAETGVRFETVREPGDLEAWERGWQVSSPAPDRRIFPASLLDDPGLAFHTAWLGRERVGGFLSNRSSGAVGLSNVFASDALDAMAFVRDCARHLRALHPERALVGYGPEAELRALATIGFRGLGPLRVWVAQATAPADSSGR